MLEELPDTDGIRAVWRISELSDFIIFLEQQCTRDDAFFRGQAEQWPLRPKLSRLRCRIETSVLETENRMLEHFSRAVVGYGLQPRPGWELVALAQHHGMATRLLDWSRNPLVALWFAIKQSPSQSRAEAVVWMLCPDSTDMIQDKETRPTAVTAVRVWEPPHVTRRISAQVGAFTVHPEIEGQFVALEGDPQFQTKLQKVLIPANRFDSIRFHLDRCGLNEASIYPDVDGLARHIEWLNSYSPDEGAWQSPSGAG